MIEIGQLLPNFFSTKVCFAAPKNSVTCRLHLLLGQKLKDYNFKACAQSHKASSKGMRLYVNIPFGELFQLFEAGRDHFLFQLSINMPRDQNSSLHFLWRQTSIQSSKTMRFIWSSLLRPHGRTTTHECGKIKNIPFNMRVYLQCILAHIGYLKK